MSPMNSDQPSRRRLRWIVFLSALIGVHRPLASSAAAAPTTLSVAGSSQVAALVKEFGPRLLKSRYMESGASTDVVVRGWEGFPTKRFTYAVTDKNGAKKSADVVLLDPSPTQMAMWIVSAIREVNGTDDDALARKAFANAIGQSGGQFPVAGVVYEDILPEDGVNEAYCFRDGVTVAVEGVKHRGVDPLSPAEIEASISGKVTRVFKYARIQSTTPEQYIAIGGAKHVLGADGKPSMQWPIAIRQEYQAAWRSERNALIVAWITAQSSAVTTGPSSGPTTQRARG